MQLLNTIKNKKKACVVECASLQGTSTYAALTAHTIAKELVVDKQLVVNEVSKLKVFVDTIPVILVLNTNKVLTRKVAINSQPTQLVSSAFPNLTLSDFYFQIYTSSQNAFVSVVRKEYVHAVLEEFVDKKINIVSFSIGFGNVNGVLPFLNKQNVTTLSHQISFESNTDTVIGVQPISDSVLESYEVEGQQIQSTHLVGLGLMINQLLSKNIIGNIIDKNKELKKAYSEQKFFKNGLLYGVGALLLILLVNAFVFNRKFTQIQLLQEEKLVFDNHRKQLEQKKNNIKKKEALVQSILNTGFSKSSFFVDRVIQIKPNSILLNQLTYQPIVKSVKKNKKIELKEKVLKVKGTSNDKKEFNNWITQLENLDFIYNVIIEEYGLVKGKQSNFEIHLNLVVE